MTEEDRVARAFRAQAAWDEFVQPTIEAARDTYAKRIVDIASTELSRNARTDKLTTLSIAMRLLDQVEAGLQEAIRDGDVAASELERIGRRKTMTESALRLLNI